MRTSMKQFVESRTTRVLVAAGIAAGLAIMATGTTGAYFSQSKDGGITGTVGSVKLDTSGGSGANGLDFTFTNLMPGVAQSATVNFQNKGTGHQDFYLVFPNATALSALNSLGSFGEVSIAVNGSPLFASKNLSDKYTCGTVSTGYPDICPVPQQMLLASDVTVGVTNSFTFAFNYASKLGNASDTHPAYAGGGVFNTYPVLKADGTKDQTTVNSTDGNGNGLPFRVVAVQVGQQP